MPDLSPPLPANELCDHFGICGGCSSQEIPYANQLKKKEAVLQELFDHNVTVAPSPKIRFYRNLMEFVCTFGHLGLRRPKRNREILDIHDCHLLSPDSNQILVWMRDAMKRHAIPDYDQITRRGFLRYVSIREAKFTNQRMVMFYTRHPEHQAMDSFVNEFREAFPVESIQWLVNDTRTDTARGTLVKAWGERELIEQFDDYKFVIRPNMFFQTNPYQAVVAYRVLKERVPEGSRLMDLYCGSATIGIYCSNRCSSVVGVEQEPANVEAAEKNLRLNGVENVTIVTEKARKTFLTVEGTFDVLVLDPPRPGLTPKVCRRILEQEIPRLLYLSCNPKTQQEDIKHLKAKYEVSEMTAFDFFPHTPHIENLAVLTLR